MNTHDENREQDRDYLWDRSQPVDTEVAELEEVLAVAQYQDDDPPIPERERAAHRFVRSRRWITLAAAAAAVALAVLGTVWFSQFTSDESDMQVTTLGGETFVGSDAIRDWTDLSVGDEVRTGTGGRARINVGRIGHVDVDEHSSLRISRMAANEQRMELARGRIEATISAPPRLFIVDTPVTTAVDLGCIYTLEIADNGDGWLEVEYGAVSLENGSHVSYVPSASWCPIVAGFGPGTPYTMDASDAFIAALAAIDQVHANGGSGDDIDLQWMAVVAREARAADTLSLWNLLPRMERDQRDLLLQVIERFIDSGFDRRGVLAAEPEALEELRLLLRELW